MSYIEKFWRDATVADVVEVMNGKEIEARFRDLDREDWSRPATLNGWTADGKKWLGFCTWTFCQVYDPPQWFLDKPEPGEWYRLLAKFPDETLQPGDEFFANGQWWPILLDRQYPQDEGIWYRRRIEQPKPEPKFAVGQRVRIIGGVCSQHVGLTATITDAANNDLAWSYFVKGGVGGWFREDCLKPVVEPEPKHYVLQVGDTVETGNGFSLIVTEHGVEVT